MKKKLLSIILMGAMVFSLTACGNDASGTETGNDAANGNSPLASTEEAGTGTAEVELPKNIEMQVPASAGGGTDVVARALSSYINTNSNSNTTVVNNTDGGGVVAMETVRSGKTDGSEVLFFHTSMCIKTATGIYEYSAAEDFKVIGTATPTEKGGYVLVVPAESGIEDVDGFISAAQDAGGSMMLGVETGGSSHIMGGMMAKALGIELNYVEAGADTDKLTALVGGSINCALVNANQAKQYIEAGKIKAVACFSATDEGGRNSILPDVPSFKEEGYDCVFGTYFFVLAGSDMDDATAQAVLALFDAAAQDPDTKAILDGAGMGLSFVPYEKAQETIAAQQETLNTICAELGLAK